MQTEMLYCMCYAAGCRKTTSYIANNYNVYVYDNINKQNLNMFNVNTLVICDIL